MKSVAPYMEISMAELFQEESPLEFGKDLRYSIAKREAQTLAY